MNSRNSDAKSNPNKNANPDVINAWITLRVTRKLRDFYIDVIAGISGLLKG